MDSKPITRRRGDTYRIRIEFFQDDGTPLPLDGTFRLVVTEQSAPAEDDVPVMELVGSIVGAAADGILDFPLTAIDADNVGEFYFEVENTTSAGDIRTILEGPFTMIQDRAKTPVFLWTADGKSAVDGSEGVFFVPLHVNDSAAYTTRDGTPILRLSYDYADATDYRALMFTEWPSLDFSRNLRLSGLFYMDESWFTVMSVNWTRFEPDAAMAMTLLLENEPGFRDLRLGAQLPHATTQIPTYTSATSGAQSWNAGWIQWVIEWDSASKTWSGRVWQPPAADPETPIVQLAATNLPDGFSPPPFYFGLTTFGVANAEIAWIKLEYLPT